MRAVKEEISEECTVKVIISMSMSKAYVEQARQQQRTGTQRNKRDERA
jgi:hypothetical protein